VVFDPGLLVGLGRGDADLQRGGFLGADGGQFHLGAQGSAQGGPDTGATECDGMDVGGQQCGQQQASAGPGAQVPGTAAKRAGRAGRCGREGAWGVEMLHLYLDTDVLGATISASAGGGKDGARAAPARAATLANPGLVQDEARG
jgi:hypothetical protein